MVDPVTADVVEDNIERSDEISNSVSVHLKSWGGVQAFKIFKN